MPGEGVVVAVSHSSMLDEASYTFYREQLKLLNVADLRLVARFL